MNYYQVIVYVDARNNSIYSAYAKEFPRDKDSRKKSFRITSIGGFWTGEKFFTNAWETYCYAENEKEAEQKARVKVEAMLKNV